MSDQHTTTNSPWAPSGDPQPAWPTAGSPVVDHGTGHAPPPHPWINEGPSPSEPASGPSKRPRRMAGLAVAGVVAVGLLGLGGLRVADAVAGDEPTSPKNRPASVDERAERGDPATDLDELNADIDELMADLDLDLDDDGLDLDQYRIDVDEPSPAEQSSAAVALNPTPTVISIEEYAAKRCLDVGPSQLVMIEDTKSMMSGVENGDGTLSDMMGYVDGFGEWSRQEAAFNDQYQVEGLDGESYRQARAQFWADLQHAIDTMDSAALMQLKGDVIDFSQPLTIDLALAELDAPECDALTAAQLGGDLS